MAKTKITRAGWDWKGDNDDIFDSLSKALEPLGITVFQSESYRGSDAFGFVFSNSDELSEEEIAEAEEFFDEDGDDEPYVIKS
jgi:hypothetical protein